MFKIAAQTFLLVMGMLLLGCEQRSEGTLPTDGVLIDLIYDLHLAEASMNRVHASRQDSVSDVLRERIASSYGISPEQMDSWLSELQQSPDHLTTVYDSVIARYERRTPK